MRGATSGLVQDQTAQSFGGAVAPGSALTETCIICHRAVPLAEYDAHGEQCVPQHSPALDGARGTACAGAPHAVCCCDAGACGSSWTSSRMTGRAVRATMVRVTGKRRSIWFTLALDQGSCHRIIRGALFAAQPLPRAPPASERAKAERVSKMPRLWMMAAGTVGRGEKV